MKSIIYILCIVLLLGVVGCSTPANPYYVPPAAGGQAGTGFCATCSTGYTHDGNCVTVDKSCPDQLSANGKCLENLGIANPSKGEVCPGSLMADGACIKVESYTCKDIGTITKALGELVPKYASIGFTQ